MRPIRISLAAAGTSVPIRLDNYADAPAAVAVEVTGGAGFTVSHSFDDPNDLVNPIAQGSMVWDTALCPAGAIAGTANTTFVMAAAPLWIRITQTGTGTVTMIVTQYNAPN